MKKVRITCNKKNNYILKNSYTLDPLELDEDSNHSSAPASESGCSTSSTEVVSVKIVLYGIPMYIS